MTSDKEKAVNDALKWLALRMKRASYVEGELLKLIKKGPLGERDKKRYDELSQDNKSLSVKDVISVLEAVSAEDDGQYGFEDFD